MSNLDSDNRENGRKRILKAGLICFNQRNSVLPCSVRDLSEDGAQLLVSDARLIPQVFELHIELHGMWAQCEIVWKTQDRIGVKFTAPVEVVSPRRTQVLDQPAGESRSNNKVVGPSVRSEAVTQDGQRDKAFAGKTILVVDDDPIFCELAVSAFNSAGAKTLYAYSGLEALDLLEETQVDAATIDLIMPEMDGFRLMAHIRHSPKTRHIPMVVVTSRHDDQARHEARLLGICSYQIKPIVWKDLIGTLAFSLDGGFATNELPGINSVAA